MTPRTRRCPHCGMSDDPLLDNAVRDSAARLEYWQTTGRYPEDTDVYEPDAELNLRIVAVAQIGAQGRPL